MRCEELRHKFMDYLFDELEDPEKVVVENHLRSCSQCGRELEEFRTTAQVMRKWPDARVGERLVFLPGREGKFGQMIRFLLPFSRRAGALRWTTRFAVAGVVFMLLFLRSEVHFSGGQFSLIVGGRKSAPALSTSPALMAEIRKIQNDHFTYMYQMLSASEKRQQDLLLTGLKQLSKKIDEQRLADLEYMGRNLQRIERNNLYNFDRTNSILADLVKVAASSYPEKR